MKKLPKNPYSPHPSLSLVTNWIAALKQKSGYSLEEWLSLCAKNGPKTEKERREWLKSEHGLGINAAWWIAERSFGKGNEEDTPEGYLKVAAQYVEAMYSGKKAGLRPLYNEILLMALSLGKDIRVCPCKTMVPVFRHHAIAEVKPSTQTRIDLGLALGRFKGRLPKRLIDTGGAAKKDRITHRIEIVSPDDVNGDLKKWFMIAYELDLGG
jgi:hypothetical protein